MKITLKRDALFTVTLGFAILGFAVALLMGHQYSQTASELNELKYLQETESLTSKSKSRISLNSDLIEFSLASDLDTLLDALRDCYLARVINTGDNQIHIQQTILEFQTQVKAQFQIHPEETIRALRNTGSLSNCWRIIS